MNTKPVKTGGSKELGKQPIFFFLPMQLTCS